jgi:hypothetical protein
MRASSAAIRSRGAKVAPVVRELWFGASISRQGPPRLPDLEPVKEWRTRAELATDTAKTLQKMVESRFGRSKILLPLA